MHPCWFCRFWISHWTPSSWYPLSWIPKVGSGPFLNIDHQKELFSIIKNPFWWLKINSKTTTTVLTSQPPFLQIILNNRGFLFSNEAASDFFQKLRHVPDREPLSLLMSGLHFRVGSRDLPRVHARFCQAKFLFLKIIIINKAEPLSLYVCMYR